MKDYKCAKCKFFTIDKSLYKKHIQKDIHLGNKCKFCKKEYDSQEDLDDHLHGECAKRYKVLIRKYKKKILELEDELQKETLAHQDTMIAFNRDQMMNIKNNIDITNDLLIYMNRKNGRL